MATIPQVRCCVTFAACLLVAAAAVGPAGAAPGKPFDLRRLQAYGQIRDRAELARSALAFLDEETSSPSQTTMGAGGGPITHEYILAQFVAAATVWSADPAVLRRAAAAAKPGEYRDCIHLILGGQGDRSETPFLIEYLMNTAHSPWLRIRAAIALQDYPDARAVPVLAKALKDPFWVKSQGDRVYDLRIPARFALQNLKKQGVKLPPDVEDALANVVTSEKLPLGR